MCATIAIVAYLLVQINHGMQTRCNPTQRLNYSLIFLLFWIYINKLFLYKCRRCWKHVSKWQFAFKEIITGWLELYEIHMNILWIWNLSRLKAVVIFVSFMSWSNIWISFFFTVYLYIDCPRRNVYKFVRLSQFDKIVTISDM